MNPLMSGDSPKRFKEEDENDLKTEKKEKINFKDKKQESEPIEDVKNNIDDIEDDKNEVNNIKDDKNKADSIQEEKIDNVQDKKIDSKLVTNKNEIYNVQDLKIDNIQDDKNDVDFNFKTANTKTSNQQSKSIQIHKEDSQHPNEDPNKTINTTKPTVNIFQFDKPKTNQSKPSPFLLEKNEVKEENKEPFVVLKEDTEEIDHIFKEKCCFYKFFKKCKKIGYGTVYITREKENKRLIFFREGTMSKLIDLLLNFDCKPYKKEKGVGFVNFKEVDGKIIKENVLLSFDSKLLIDDFYEIIRN